MKKYMSSIYDLFIHETTTISSKTPEIINTLFYQDVNNSFKLPLEFVPETKEVNKSIITDLELSNDNINIDSKNETIYQQIFSPSTEIGKVILNKFSEKYTTNVLFLRETQKLIEKIKEIKQEEKDKSIDLDAINTWKEIHYDTQFITKYGYIEEKLFGFVNKSSILLLIKSFLSILSPVISLLSPLFIVIIPFVILKIKGINISFEMYKTELFKMISTHSIGKLFTINQMEKLEDKLYAIFSAIIYGFSIYNNVENCRKFLKNITKFQEYTFSLRQYLERTIEKIKSFLEITKVFPSYDAFNSMLMDKVSVLYGILISLQDIVPFSSKKLSFKLIYDNIMQVGNIQHIFYKLHTNETYKNAISFSFGFIGYLENLFGLSEMISSKKMNICKYLSKKNRKRSQFNKMYLVSNAEENIYVKNDYCMNKNILITGINASGKSTILKTLVINVLLCQQVGFGFFENAKLYPYKYIHCYLNIIDTCDRYSLFQNECKKCKDILEEIENNPKDSHLCVFDELFSGTNPDDAVICGYNMIKYIIENYEKNVHILLTTHFNKICYKLNKNKYIVNKKMLSFVEENNVNHTYTLCDGINELKGGIQILKQFNFPAEITI